MGLMISPAAGKRATKEVQTQEEMAKRALVVLLSACQEFPGLVTGEHVDGYDLSDWLSALLHAEPKLKRFIGAFNALTGG